jgi:hypothetical protein
VVKLEVVGEFLPLRLEFGSEIKDDCNHRIYLEPIFPSIYYPPRPSATPLPL